MRSTSYYPGTTQKPHEHTVLTIHTTVHNKRSRTYENNQTKLDSKACSRAEREKRPAKMFDWSVSKYCCCVLVRTHVYLTLPSLLACPMLTTANGSDLLKTSAFLRPCCVHTAVHVCCTKFPVRQRSNDRERARPDTPRQQVC